MGLSVIMKRGGDDYREYKKALKMAKKSIEILCELTEDMEDEYGYGERDDRDYEIVERGGSRVKHYR